jgi:hypothetical protein
LPEPTRPTRMSTIREMSDMEKRFKNQQRSLALQDVAQAVAAQMYAGAAGAMK